MRRMGGGFLAVLAVAFVGCGESAPPAETTAAQSPSVPAVAEALARKLKAAGIAAEATALSEGESRVEVGGVEIVYLADPSEAAKEGAALLKLAAGHPQKAMADVNGRIVAWIARERPLTSAERARFEEVAKIVNSPR
jgi:hypothetical protein